MNRNTEEISAVVAGLRDQIANLESRLATLVRTQRLEIVDSNGKARAWLCVTDDGTSALNLADATGCVRASISVDRNGTSGLALYDDRGEARVKLELSELSYPVMVLKDSQGQVDVRLQADPAGRTGLVISGDGLAGCVDLTVSRDRGPSLLLRHRDGKEVVIGPE